MRCKWLTHERLDHVDVCEWSDHFANGGVFILYLVAILRTAVAGLVAPKRV
jgi:hypothetical protein